MKRILFLTVLVFSYYLSKSQCPYADNFDNINMFNFPRLTHIFDTTHNNNIWHIGSPQKSIFNGAYSSPNVLITDTINSYPTSDTSIIIFKAKLCYHGYFGTNFQFFYKLNTDSLSDYGKVEMSGDNGNTYYDLFLNPNIFYYQLPPNQTIFFTGNSNGWQNIFMNINTYLLNNPPIDTLYIKFTFISDSIQTNKDGWMIEDILVDDWYEGVNDIKISDVNTKCFPIPASDNLTFEYMNYSGSEYKFEIINCLGSVVYNNVHNIEKFNLDISEFKQGVYFYKLSDNKNQSTGKFIKK